MDFVLYFGWTVFAASLGYLLVAVYCVLSFGRRLSRPAATPKGRPGVTLYKPLCGTEYGMKENLLSFCRQDYPDYQVVFGVSDADDPAISVVRGVISACPDVDAELVVNGGSNGNNPKVSNLINMDAVARHDILIISDSDMRVEADYVERVVAGFDSDRVGLVTCLYKGTPAPGLASHLGAMFINQWFTPSALIPALFGKMKHCFGATMAIMRDVLNEIGRLDAIAANLADDYTLGRLVREAGYEIRLADVVVENMVEEADLKALVLHELRWARTIRAVEPKGFLSTFLTDTVPLGLVLGGAVFLAGHGWAWAAAPVVLALSFRLLLHFATRATFPSQRPVPFWLIPVRDLLSFFVRLLCYTGGTVNWRNSVLSVGKGGKIGRSVPRRTVKKRYEKNSVPESPVV